MRSLHGLVILVALAGAACAAPQPRTPQTAADVAVPAAPAVPLVGVEEVARSFGTGNGARASVKLVAPKPAYILHDAETVHHWEANDIIQYVVELKRQLADQSFDNASAVSVKVWVKGADPKTTAVFTNVPWGSNYRAYVTALGNVHGVVGDPIENSVLLPLNTVAGTADFDFTSTQDVVARLTKPVQIVFDATPFSGSATVRITSPSPGFFVNPQDPVTGAAESDE
jgi:hypothetical protein